MFSINAINEGETDIDITGENGTTCVLHVIVTPKPVVTLKCGTNPTISTKMSYPWFEKTDDSISIADATSSNPEVLTIPTTGVSYDIIKFSVKKEGETTVTVTGSNGSTTSIFVTVKKPYYSALTDGDIIINSGSSWGSYVTYAQEVHNWYWPGGFDTTESDLRVFAQTGDDRIARVDYDVQDERIVRIDGYDPGTTYLKLDDGQMYNVIVRLTQSYFDKRNTVENAKDDCITYGEKRIWGNTLPYATVSTTIDGKKYECIANSLGNYVLPIPTMKCGKSFKVQFAYEGKTSDKWINIVSNSNVKMKKYVYRNTTKVTCIVKNAHKGDVLKIKIGKKQYKKKITKNRSKYTLSVKIKKPQKYGIRMKVTLRDRFGGLLFNNKRSSKKHKYVFYGYNVKIGMTERQVEWLAYWGVPNYVNFYSHMEQWVYDWGYVYFRNGRVIGWQD